MLKRAVWVRDIVKKFFSHFGNSGSEMYMEGHSPQTTHLHPWGMCVCSMKESPKRYAPIMIKIFWLWVAGQKVGQRSQRSKRTYTSTPQKWCVCTMKEIPETKMSIDGQQDECLGWRGEKITPALNYLYWVAYNCIIKWLPWHNFLLICTHVWIIRVI